MNHTLSWLKNEDLENAISQLQARIKAATKNVDQRIRKNVVDPFSSLLIASAFEAKGDMELKNLHRSSSISSGISSAIGNFHQSILSRVSGWENHDAGYDLMNNERKIIAEVKNKHNTMNASNREQVINELSTALKQKGYGWIAYLVIIIPKKPNRYETGIQTTGGRDIREIDGASFYTMITGQETALRDLFNAVLSALNSVKELPQEVQDYCVQILNRSIP